MPKIGQLSEREKKFAIAYVYNGGHSTQAAIKAGYGANRASQAGSRLCNRERVWGEIQRLMQKKVDKFEKSEIWSAEEKRAMLKRMAMAAESKKQFVSVACIQEDNKMAGHHNKELPTESSGAQVILTMPDNGRAPTDG